MQGRRLMQLVRTPRAFAARLYRQAHQGADQTPLFQDRTHQGEFRLALQQVA
ncbi:hypothetical protein D9M69_724290 [compost metagenome]